MRVRILGCGSSLGVPVVGCKCKVCTSDNPKNSRMRTSILIESGDARVLVDTSPDLRRQLVMHGITAVNHVIYTHEHADHCHGIDELRIMRMQSQPVTVYGSQQTIDGIYHKFSYMFEDSGSDVGFLGKKALDWYDSFEIDGLQFESYRQHHGEIDSVGYKVGRMAYSTDVRVMPEASMDVLVGTLDVFIVGCIGYEAHHSHANLDQCLEWVSAIKPQLTILTHLGHHVDYDELMSRLPNGVVAAYDGMVVDI